MNKEDTVIFTIMCIMVCLSLYVGYAFASAAQRKEIVSLQLDVAELNLKADKLARAYMAESYRTDVLTEMVGK